MSEDTGSAYGAGVTGYGRRCGEMGRVLKYPEHVAAIKKYIQEHQAFPKPNEANEYFQSLGLEPLSRLEYDRSVRNTIINRKGFAEANPWFKPEPRKKKKQSGEQQEETGKSYPTINEKREAVGLEPYKKDRQEAQLEQERTQEPDTITMRVGNITRGKLATAYDLVFKTAQLHDYERFDMLIKIIKR
jgi:hypothetical protein